MKLGVPSGRLIALANLVFFSGLFLSALPLWTSHSAGLYAALVSSLQSPEENPHRYGVACAGTALCGALLAPVVWRLYRTVRTRQPWLAACGVVLLASGVAIEIAIGCLAPFRDTYEPLHVPLAYAVFISMDAGLLVFTARAGRGGWLRSLAALQTAAVCLLIYLWHDDRIFDGSAGLPRLVACEWTLCVLTAVSWHVVGAVSGAVA
jgi:hypothetical protein